MQHNQLNRQLHRAWLPYRMRLWMALSSIAISGWIIWREVQRAGWALEQGVDIPRYRVYHPSVDTILPWSIGAIIMLIALGIDSIATYRQRAWRWDGYLIASIVLAGSYGWMLILMLQR